MTSNSKKMLLSFITGIIFTCSLGYTYIFLPMNITLNKQKDEINNLTITTNKLNNKIALMEKEINILKIHINGSFVKCFLNKNANYYYHEQREYNSCGPACVQMLLHINGIDNLPNQEQIANEMNTTIYEYTFTDQIYKPFKKRNININQIFVNPKNAMSQLKENIDDQKGIIVLTNYTVGNPSGHFRIVVGYNSTGIFFHDPWYDLPYSGPYCYMRNEEFEEIWSSYCNYWIMINDIS